MKKNLLIVIGLCVFSLVGCNVNGDNNNDKNNNANIQNVNDNDRNNRYEVADEAADRVENLKEVNNAYVITTDNNAYVAATLKDNEEGKLTRDIEKKISKQVKDTDKDIDNVYVSTNPDFFKRMGNYANKVQNGNPIQGLGEEFSETIRRVFPNQR
ncbi:YhcN/YlaJ family sporulation lipoprotein [Pseudalkalibacillus caeni]|uniref:YhcN/YlaJ family sporulation lipoprotein n=1 Tax=Exobacillus caeni TaxID=2574798 RepID=A0A5R9F8V6_9BACL|nr:YhcN/YlaJ family sporulation lipoprotein [Pseudalkalibacillus caeni]TLS36964.1 YhcN/YlaJ family sporulation lipoprotein [Pseudalkalibacillus caeni]